MLALGLPHFSRSQELEDVRGQRVDLFGGVVGVDANPDSLRACRDCGTSDGLHVESCGLKLLGKNHHLVVSRDDNPLDWAGGRQQFII